MNTDSNVTSDPVDRLTSNLAGRSAWIITDGKAGMVVQARGVADALGLNCEMKTVTPRGFSKYLAPWGTISSSERFGQPDSAFAPPWPAVAIATGRASIPYIRALKMAAGAACYTVVLQDPKSGPKTADLIWVPQHDTLRGPNIITTPTSPHSFSATRMASLRKTIPPGIERLPGPRVTIIIGGKNSAYKFTEADDARLEHALRSIAKLGVSFMITTSRRTHQRLLNAVDKATSSSPRILWTGDGPNPYASFLAHADALVVTADSVNMTGEACATGRPVHVFMPSGGSAKFTRFHDALRAYGATRELPDEVAQLATWDYQPLDSARLIAQQIADRWQRRAMSQNEKN